MPNFYKMKKTYFLLALFVICGQIASGQSKTTEENHEYRFHFNSQTGIIGELKHEYLDGERTKMRGIYTGFEVDFRVKRRFFVSTSAMMFESIFTSNKTVDYERRDMSGLRFQLGLKYTFIDFSDILGLVVEGGYSYTHAKVGKESSSFWLPKSYDEPGYFLSTEFRINPKRRFSIGLLGNYTDYHKTGSWYSFGVNLNFKLT